MTVNVKFYDAVTPDVQYVSHCTAMTSTEYEHRIGTIQMRDAKSS